MIVVTSLLLKALTNAPIDEFSEPVGGVAPVVVPPPVEVVVVDVFVLPPMPNAK